MKPCTKVGIDTTWKCSCRCQHCFYRWDERFRSAPEVPLAEVIAKIEQAKAGGLDHVHFVGFGEPAMGRHTEEIIEYAHGRGMATSMITSGVTSIKRYKRFHELEMDHLHISSHGVGETMDRIMDHRGAFEKQARLKDWMGSVAWPFRANATLQQDNYQQLPDLAEYEISKGVFHFVFLGFRPFYQWADRTDHIQKMVVHPAKLRPYIEAAAKILLDAGTLFTIRYHPFCHLDPRFWPYVVNARYVFFDNTEWNYQLQAHDQDTLWKASVAMGDSLACREPCTRCLAYNHCGGWNRSCADVFNGAGLQPIPTIPDVYQEIWNNDGGLHDLNPATRIPSRIRGLNRKDAK